jgi:hypothetical protein
MKRPTSITVIAWFYIIFTLIGFLSSYTMMQTPEYQQMMEAMSAISSQVILFLTYAGMIITLVCAYGFLKGFNWSRWLFVIWSVLGFIVGIIGLKQGLSMVQLVSVALFALVCYFLFCATGNAWFTHSKVNQSTTPVELPGNDNA